MTSFRLYVILLLAQLAAVASAASDTDVTFHRADKVTIEKDQVTIIAKATTSVMRLRGNETGTRIMSERAVFTIKRPVIAFPDPDGIHDEKYKMMKAGLEDAWTMTLQAAQNLADGQVVGRIGFYQPEIVIRDGMVASITGDGYLYPKGK